MVPIARGRWGAAWLLLLLLGVTAAAQAQSGALVVVTLHDSGGEPAEGQVSLLDGDGKPVADCQTQKGRCEMRSVPGGSYSVTVKPRKGSPPKPRTVMIPPSGKVSLIVATGGA